MKVRVLFFAHLRELAGSGEHEFDLPDGITIGGLAEELTKLDIRFRGMLKYARPAINGEWATVDSPLTAGDEVGFLPPSSGG
jgi:molybdopterin converting factor small subunit